MPDFDLVAVTLASLAAGFVNSIAGGGGLVSLPILFSVFPSAAPAELFGTNKASMVCGTAWAAADYARHVRLPWRTLVPAIAAALVGGLIGAWLVTQVSSDWLRRLLPVMLAIVLVLTVLGRDLGADHAPAHTGAAEAALASAIAFTLGLYDGFFGPGTGTFLIFLFVRALGFDFLHAVASAKVINMTTNIAALAWFGWTGNVWWRFFVPMAVANVVGSFLGTRLALRHGSWLIRVVFLAVVAALILKTGFDAYRR
jgi:uncharacterized membrane protein YfcA